MIPVLCDRVPWLERQIVRIFYPIQRWLLGRSLANPAVGGQRFQEAHVTSAHGRHFAKTLRGGQVAVIVVTRHSTNLGLGWAQLKAAIPEVESLMS